ncbi:MAG: DoxX family protein [Bacteroidales bacterium]|nr:DoxX family protein [Bacteroidales bacterium]
MKTHEKTFGKIDSALIGWMTKNGISLLRISIGLIFFWFGILKFFEGLSPAEDLATRTISAITFNLVPDKVIIYGLAAWEVLIGVGLIFNIFMRVTLFLLFLQMLGTFFPLFLFPGEIFHVFPVSLTLEGQYIIKNIVIISGGIVLGSTLRPARLFHDH